MQVKPLRSQNLLIETVFQNCLSRWKSEVEEDIKQLEASILQVEKVAEWFRNKVGQFVISFYIGEAHP